MTVSDEVVARYFAPPREPLWRWSADGSAITTFGGKTIAFTQEIDAVIERLAPKGLPPFGAIVLLLAACRDGWKDDVELRGAIAQISCPVTKSAGTVIARSIDVIVSRRVTGILAELDGVNLLKHDLRRTPQGKAFLAESIFESAERRVRPPDAEMMLQGLRRGIPREMLQPVDFDSGESLLADLDVLCSSKMNTGELELRHETGLDETPVAAEREAPLPDRARKLLEALRSDNDAELSGLARLALDLLAAVHVPRTLTQCDELPLGGFTDISNRGHLDRLLISELAHDDLTLSVRVALNEALYLRRESPPRTPPQHREILIDSGIRMWGLPRAFAASVALALIATAETESEIHCYRASGAMLLSAELVERAGLVEHLGALESEPHPAEAVREFMNAVNARPDSAGAADAILITHPDALDDAEFRTALAAIPDLNLYAASVDREGNFRLLHFTPSGHTLVREAKFEIEAIFAPRSDSPRVVPLKDKKIDPNLPVILSLEEFPFLLPYPYEPKRCRMTEKGALYTVTRDGRLLRRESSKTGARQLSDKVPAGAVRKIIVDGEQNVYVVIDPQQGGNLLLYNAMSADSRPTISGCLPLKGRGKVPQEVLLQNGLFVVIYDRQIDVYQPRRQSGGNTNPLSTYELNSRHEKWVHGRFFKRYLTWYQLTLSTPSGRVALIEHPAKDCVALILARRETKGIGPWALSKTGALTPSLQGEAVQFDLQGKMIAQLLDATDDGNRLLVKMTDNSYAVLDADMNKVVFGTSPGEFWLDMRLAAMNHPPPLRSRLKSVGLSGNGTLLIGAKSGTVYRLVHNPTQDRLAFEKWVGPSARMVAFSPTTRPPDTRYRVTIARLPDGVTVFHDSRGLLHLKSGDKSLPEISFVLDDIEVACWSSDGEQCGINFYLQANVMKVSAKNLFDKISGLLRRSK